MKKLSSVERKAIVNKVCEIINEKYRNNVNEFVSHYVFSEDEFATLQKIREIYKKVEEIQNIANENKSIKTAFSRSYSDRICTIVSEEHNNCDNVIARTSKKIIESNPNYPKEPEICSSFFKEKIENELILSAIDDFDIDKIINNLVKKFYKNNE